MSKMGDEEEGTANGGQNEKQNGSQNEKQNGGQNGKQNGQNERQNGGQNGRENGDRNGGHNGSMNGAQLQQQQLPPQHKLKFGDNCCFLTREAFVVLILLMIGGVVATGLLVYYFAPHQITSREGRALDTSSSAVHQGNSKHGRPAKIIDGSSKDSQNLSPKMMSKEEMMMMENEDGMKMKTGKEEEEVTEESKRLPRSLKPVHYLVKLQPLINGNFSILGYVEVEVEVIHSTSNITLHIADIITHNDTIKVVESGANGGQETNIKRHEYDHDREFYIAYLEEPLKKGHKYILSMSYTGLLNDKLVGFYRSNYRKPDGSLTMVAATQFQSRDARRAFPCFDEPGLKATFDIHLARETNMTSLSNMPIKETIPVTGQNGWVWDHYETTVPMSTYPLAFVVSDFVYMNATTPEGTLFRVWARKEALPQADYSLDAGVRMLSYFSDFFHQPYDLPKMDMVALPDFAPGAMENWGLVLYREIYMLYDPLVSAAFNKQLVAAVIAHEMAHMWFGNLVTPKWWNDIWLNEGFASYFEYLAIHHVEPSWHIFDQFLLKRNHPMLLTDSLYSTRPIIGKFVDAAAVIYDKGSAVSRMLNHIMGEDTFRRGISDFLTAHKYSTADSDDVWNALTAAGHRAGVLPANVTIKTIMDTWTLQKGYPVITISRSNDGTTANVYQERFLLGRLENYTDTHDYKWWIPLTYTSETEQDFSQTQPRVWMRDSEDRLTITDLPSKDRWVIFNLQETSYYRVNYDMHNWRLITAQLLKDHTVIHPSNRAQIIDDALDLARAGHLPYTIALDVLGYLAREEQYVPWSAALDNLSFIKDMFTYTSGYGPLKRYLVNLVGPLFRAVGFEDRPSDPHLAQFKRQKAMDWACKLGLPDCLHRTSAAFASWVANPHNNTISANLKSTVYCHAIAEGGEEEWTFAWNQYLKSNVGSEKTKLLKALGCSKKLWILSRYLDMAMNESSGIKKQDSFRVVVAVAKNKLGRPLVWNYLQNDWHRIHNYGFRYASISMLMSVAKNFNTQTQLQELVTFSEAHKSDLKQSELRLAQTVEKARHNTAWMQNHYSGIMEWLDRKSYVRRLPSA